MVFESWKGQKVSNRSVKQMMSLVDACVCACVCVSRPLGELSLRTFSDYTDTKAGHICSEMAAQMNRVFSCPEQERPRPLPLCASLNGALSVAIGKHSSLRQMIGFFLEKSCLMCCCRMTAFSVLMTNKLSPADDGTDLLGYRNHQ